MESFSDFNSEAEDSICRYKHSVQSKGRGFLGTVGWHRLLWRLRREIWIQTEKDVCRSLICSFPTLMMSKEETLFPWALGVLCLPSFYLALLFKNSFLQDLLLFHSIQQNLRLRCDWLAVLGIECKIVLLFSLLTYDGCNLLDTPTCSKALQTGDKSLLLLHARWQVRS